MITYEIKALIRGVIVSLQKNRIFPEFEIPEIVIDCPANKEYGDFSTGVVLKLGKYFSQEPSTTAKVLRDRLAKAEIFSKVEVAGPGFINFFISPKYLHNKVKEVLKQKGKFGTVNLGKNRKVNVEFISANPTGPLTLGNGRGGFCGDVLSKVLSKAGYKVTKEHYINDRGEQIIKLGHSVLRDEQAVYKGEYIEELNKHIKGLSAQAESNPELIGDKAAEYILEKMMKPAVARMGIKFDVWFSEKKLYDGGWVDKTIADLTRRGFTYRSEGATWFKSKDLGDDKDRVLIRKDGVKTYFASDIAYLKNKISRGFEKIILFVGADHHGYINRLKAAGHTLSFNKENIDVVVMQLVQLFKDGKEFKMSKRAGTYVTLDELLDEVSLDVARFFFLQRASTTHLNFDLNLAKEQSQKNPVYYIQYAHARICSIIKKTGILLRLRTPNFELLKDQTELNLINQVIRLPEVVQETAMDYQVQRLTQYATELADAFHNFYEKCHVITKDKKLSSARLSLILATKIVLKNTLDLMGISSPEKM